MTEESPKGIVEGLSESMPYELEPFGIKVILIEPGFVKTNFQQATIRSQHPNSPYSQMMQKRAAVSSQFFQNGSAPDLVAKVVLAAINTPNPNLRYLRLGYNSMFSFCQFPLIIWYKASLGVSDVLVKNDQIHP